MAIGSVFHWAKALMLNDQGLVDNKRLDPVKNTANSHLLSDCEVSTGQLSLSFCQITDSELSTFLLDSAVLCRVH